MSTHFRRIDFSSDYGVTKKSKDYVDLLISLSALVNLNSLKLNSTYLKCLFVEFPNRLEFDQSLADQSDVAVALRLILSRVTTLELHGTDGYQLASILSRTNKRLTSLTLTHCGAHVVHDTLEATQLQDSLVGFKNLEQLTIEHSANLFKAIDISSMAVYPLRSLSLYHYNFDALHVQFIACFAPTLEFLSYDSPQDYSDVPLTLSLLSTPFPHLKSLRIIASSDLYFATSPALTPSLLSLDISASASFFERMAAFLPGHLVRIPSIQYLRIGAASDDRMPRQPRQALLQAFSETTIKLEFTTPQDLLLAGEEEILERGEWIEETPVDEYIGRRKEEVREVLDFGAKYQEQIVKTGDTVGMDRLVEALRPLKMLHDFQEED
ncbi:hypothetical protein JCM5353_004688 [Sporobolomyces roseus]